ncbi:LGFP repeat-containing protein [Nocardia sp. NPDC057030]|uniref:LGFP repeat-containing protein n=1 Tax=unclassified Nocardia TaxID=2637762 RepID=UPI003627A8FF
MPGRMRSDCQKIPDGFTKEQADKAETMEAAVAARPQQRSATATDGCQVYWPAPYEVCGAIRDKYNELGGPNSFLLFPTSNELSNPDGVGKRSTFQNGPIYWSPVGGAHPVVNHFFAAWQRNGWEGGVLGYPTSDELVNPDNIGRRQYFQGGTIYWKLNEAYYVAGAIRDKWGETGWEGGSLGYPTSDEIKTPDGQGRFNRFERGVIYWSPSTGAHPVSGLILIEWSSEQYEAGLYGYPVGDERSAGGSSREQDFQNGRIRVPTPVNGGDGADEDKVDQPGPGGRDYAPDADWRTSLPTQPGSTAWNRCRETQSSNSDITICAGSGYTDIPDPTATAPGPQLRADPITLRPGCDRDYAKKRSDALAGRPLTLGYWQIDRLYACGVNPNTVVLRDKQGKVIGSASGKLEQELITRGDRTQTEYRVRFTVEKMTSTVFTVTGRTPCTGVACSVTVHDEIVNERLTPGGSVFGFYEFGPGTLAPNQILTLIMALNLEYSSPGGHETSPGSATISSFSPEIRCDDDRGVPGISARLPGQGCVFPNRVGVMDFASDPNLTTIADHVRKAQQSGLPGAPRLYSNGTLSRMTDFNQRERNGARACPSGRYSVAGFSCDEYPFRSTYQGAAQPPNVTLPPNGRTFPGCRISDMDRVDPSRTGPNGYSVCMVPTTPVDANGEQAKVIARFYYDNRVRDGDKFYIRADPSM